MPSPYRVPESTLVGHHLHIHYHPIIGRKAKITEQNTDKSLDVCSGAAGFESRADYMIEKFLGFLRPLETNAGREIQIHDGRLHPNYCKSSSSSSSSSIVMNRTVSRQHNNTRQ
jgi:hypothetical protein